MFMGVTRSKSGLFRSPGFIVSPVGKGEKKQKKQRKEKGIEEKEGRKEEGIKKDQRKEKKEF